MKQYIDKDALVAEVKKRIKETESMQPKFDQFWAGQISAFKGVLKILDTLEPKEAELKKELNDFIEEQKSAWSYEDEANLNNIIWLCNNCIKGSETTWIPSQAKKIKHLIETIKERGFYPK